MGPMLNGRFAEASSLESKLRSIVRRLREGEAIREDINIAIRCQCSSSRSYQNVRLRLEARHISGWKCKALRCFTALRSCACVLSGK